MNLSLVEISGRGMWNIWFIGVFFIFIKYKNQCVSPRCVYFFLLDTIDAIENNASNGSRITTITGYSKVTYVLTLTYNNNFIPQESKFSSTDRAKINICYPWLLSISVYPPPPTLNPNWRIAKACTITPCTTGKKYL